MKSSIALLVLCAQISAVYMQTGDECQFRYLAEPGPTVNSCNIIGSGLNITCRVESKSSIQIVWHFTRDRSTAGVDHTINTLITYPSDDYNTSTMAEGRGAETFTTQTLHVKKVNDGTLGYYWCTVRLNSVVELNPSQVVHVSDQCATTQVGSCPFIAELVQERSSPQTPLCTDGELRNVSIVEAQDLKSVNCSVPTEPTMAGTTVSVDADTTVSKEEPTTTIVTETTTNLYTSTFVLQQTTVEVATGSPQGISVEIIWLTIGVVLALLLLGVIGLLAVIACLQCKKRRIKGLESTTEGVPDQAFASMSAPSETTFASRSEQFGSTPKDKEIEAGPDYEEVPNCFIRLGAPNPNFTTSTSSAVTYSPTSDHYEDLSVRIERPGSKTSVNRQPSLPDPPFRTWSANQTKGVNRRPSLPLPPLGPRLYKTQSVDETVKPVLKKPSLSILPDPQRPLRVSVDETKTYEVFDDPAYASPTNQSPQPQEESGQRNRDSYTEEMGAFFKMPAPRKTSSRPSHNYTPVLPTTGQRNDYTQTILDSDEKYVSEIGHVYQVLDNSTNSGNASDIGPNFKILESSINLENATEIGHVYQVLEPSTNSGNAELAEALYEETADFKTEQFD